MRQCEKRHRQNHKKPPTKHFKRTLKVGQETWSWQPFKGQLRLRGPDGTNYTAPSEAFRERIEYGWGGPGQEDLPYYCCEFCSPTWGGPGYSPKLIRRYIRVVILGGGEWDRKREWNGLWWKQPDIYFTATPNLFPFREATHG